MNALRKGYHYPSRMGCMARIQLLKDVIIVADGSGCEFPVHDIGPALNCSMALSARGRQDESGQGYPERMFNAAPHDTSEHTLALTFCLTFSFGLHFDFMLLALYMRRLWWVQGGQGGL
jgi:hypothetical protein